MVGADGVRAFTPADATLEAEQEVWLSLKEGATHLFDRQTEQALSIGRNANA
jgi:hypothetical protein